MSVKKVDKETQGKLLQKTPEPQQEEVLLPPPVPPEIFDHSEAFARRRLPRIYHAKDSSSTVIVDPERYEITDMSFRSTRDINEVLWTQAHAVINVQSQLEPTIVDDGNIKYTVLGGSGSVTIENVSKPIERETVFVVEKGVTHSIINTSKTEKLTVLIDYSGKDILDLRDLYKPLEQTIKRAEISRQKVMNMPQKKEEVKTTQPVQKTPTKKASDDHYV